MPYSFEYWAQEKGPLGLRKRLMTWKSDAPMDDEGFIRERAAVLAKIGRAEGGPRELLKGTSCYTEIRFIP